MNFVPQFKIFIKLFPPFLVAMLGGGHTVSEVSSLTNHTPIWIFGLKYDATLWTCLGSLFVTIIAFLVAITFILNIGASYRKQR